MSLKSNVTSRVAVAAVTAGLTLCFWATPALANDAVAENLDQEPAVVYVSLAAVEEAEPTEAVKDVIAADAGSETAVVSSPGIEFDGKEGQPISSPVVDTELRDDEEHSGDAGHNAEKNLSSDSKADPESSTDPKPAPEPEPEPEPEPKPQKGWWTDAATGAREYYNQGVLVWRLSADGTLDCFATDDFDYDSRRFLVVGHAEAVTPHNVSYTDPDTGLRYWYENGRRVEEHCYVDHETFEWSWADKGGVVACGKDVYIPRDETRKNADGTWGDGKWVRVDDSYSLVKGEDYRKSTNDGKMHWWLFDAETGEMLKNFVHVSSNGGKWCYYDDTYGWMVYGEQYRMTKDDPSAGYHWYYFDDNTGATTYGWKYLSGAPKWVWYDTVTGVMAHGSRIIDGFRRNFDNVTGACDKVGFQNDPRYYQVSSWNVSVPGRGQWAYATPSCIGVDATLNDCIELMISRAYEYLGTPYVWDYSCAPGVGVDCAGLVMQCLYATGMDLSPYTPWDHYFTPGHDHYANDMWNDGRFMHVEFGERKRGDLICYSGHIAIYLGNDQIIEAYKPGIGVRISSVYSSSGIKGALRPFS